MKTIDNKFNTCRENNGSQRLKAPGSKRYFCKYSCDNDNVPCDAFDPSRTHSFGSNADFYGCKINETLIPGELSKSSASNVHS